MVYASSSLLALETVSLMIKQKSFPGCTEKIKQVSYIVDQLNLNYYVTTIAANKVSVHCLLMATKLICSTI